MQAVETGAHARRDLVRRQHARRFHDPPPAVHPLRLDRVEPRTLRGQGAGNDPPSLSCLLDRPIVRPDPCPHRFAHMPTRVVPHQHARPFPLYRQPVAAPIEARCGDPAHGSPVHETQPQPLGAPFGGSPVSNQQAIAGECVRVGVAACRRLLDQSQWCVPLRPTRQMWSGDPAPPDLVGKAACPIWMRCRQPDPLVAPPLFRAYAGLGLVIHGFARCPRTPSRSSVTRTVAPVTRSPMIPSAPQTAAARSRVHRLVGARRLVQRGAQLCCGKRIKGGSDPLRTG